MWRHAVYEKLVNAWPIRKGKGRLLTWATRALNIQPYGDLGYRAVGAYRLQLDPGDLNDRLYYFDLIGSGYHWLMKRVLRRGDTVIDVGANVGYFSAIAALQIGNSGSVYAIEANPSLARRLQTMANGVPDGPIRVTWAAVWRETGMVTLKIDKKWSGWASLVENPTFSADEAIEVKAITIDSFIAQNQIGPVRLLKLDIEGAETDALHGATQMLEKHQADIIQVETEPHRMRAFGHPGWQLAEMMSNHDYQPIAVIQNEVVRALQNEELTPGSVVGDYIFVHSSVVDEIVPLLFGGSGKS